MDKGFVIAFEGGEGSGKSTALPVFERLLIDAGFKVKTYAEPGGTAFAQSVRELFFKQELNVKTSVHLMNSQRQDNIDHIIQPYIDKGYVVLIDRFIASTIVYQGILNTRLGDLPDKAAQRKWVTNHVVPYDHIVFFFDCPPEVSMSRVSKRGQDNYFDELDFDKHTVIYQGYKQVLDTVVSSTSLARDDAMRMMDDIPTISYVPGCFGVKRIDACDSVEGVTQQLTYSVNELIDVLTE